MLIAISAAIAPAAADPVRTTDAVVLRRKPAEHADAVANLPAGTEVVVEAEQGRWLRVRSGAAVGYLTRTTVTPTRPVSGGASGAWSQPRRAAQPRALFVVVTAPTSALRSRPDPAAAPVAELGRGARVEVVDASGRPGWIRGRDEHGSEGWLARADVDNGTAGVAISGATATAPGAPAASATGPTRARRAIALRAEAGIGYRSLGMELSSNGTGALANYLVAADAAAALVDVDLAVRVSDRVVVGLDAELAGSHASPGIDYPGPRGAPGTIPFSTLATDAGARAGIRLRDVFVLALRGGVHYDAFVASDVDNAGLLPRERLLGLTAGARVDVVPPRSRISAGLRVDALVLGSRRQTVGLEDGTDSTARAVWAGVSLRVSLRRPWSLVGAYDFGRATTAWTGMSVREPDITAARRVDHTQQIVVGVGAEL